MIPSARFINIQSHTDTEVDFHPGINLLCGESDVGKSAIVRGLEWWALNNPPQHGGEIRRHETKGSSVEIKGEVKKFRSASLHHYEMDGKKFKALRTDVPPEIQTAINLSEASFQGQHSPYFLISDNPGTVAKSLNAVGDLTIIDLSLKAARAKVKEANTEEKFLKGEVKEKTEKIDGLSWAVEADKDYRVIETLEAEAAAIEVLLLGRIVATIDLLQEKFSGLPDTSTDLDAISAALKSLEVDETLGHVVAKVEENQITIPDSDADRLEIERLLDDLKVDSSLLDSYEYAAALEFEAEQFPAEIDDVKDIEERLVRLTLDCKEMESKFLEAYTAEDCLEEAATAHEQGKLEFNNKLKELGQCPLCGGELDEDYIPR